MARSAHPPLTYDDLLAMPEDGLRHELIDGEHIVSASPNTKHQRVSGNFYYVIRAFLHDHPLGEIFYAPFDVVFSQTNVAVPDLLFVSQASSILTDRCAQGAPDLVIEILSRSTRGMDQVRKRDLYDRCGVGEYWIVDPFGDGTRIYRRSAGSLALAAELSAAAGDALTTPLLPGLEIALSEIFT